MQCNRRGETGTIPTRTERYQIRSDGWYVATREGRFEGPFENILEAKRALDIYLRRMGIIRKKAG